MGMTNFRASDMPGSAKKIAYAKSSKPKGSDIEPEAPAVDPDAVPAGTAAEVLSWVDGDIDKAQRALDVENDHDKPRVTLISELESVILKDEESGEDA